MAKLTDSELARQEHNVNTAWQNLQDDFNADPDIYIVEAADAIELLRMRGCARARGIISIAMLKLMHEKEQQTGETV